MQLLEFIFQSPWHFFGFLLLLMVAPMSVAAMIKSTRRDWLDRYVDKLPDQSQQEFIDKLAERDQGPRS